jgi:arylsulfatase A-like enzyme
MRRPHIVLFNPDQWRGDVLGHVGNPAASTPHLDRLVTEEAVSFRNAFCQNPVCTPSRCSFMTGWYPHVRGHRTMHYMLRPDEPSLLESLKENGYFVWWGGKNDLIPAGTDPARYCDVRYRSPRPPPIEADLHSADAWRGEVGGDNYYSFHAGRLEPPAGESDYYDSDWADVRGALEAIRQAPREQPLCLYLALGYPHPPYGVEQPWHGAIERGKLPPRTVPPASWRGKPSILRRLWERQNLQAWSEERWTELRATYYGMCARVDHQFGLLLRELKQAGIYDDTLILFFSDHGDFAGDFGLVEKTQNTFEDCLTRVPLVIKPPAWRPARAGVSEALAELVDIPATVFDLAGFEPSHTHFGRSLMPLVGGEAKESREAVFCEGGRLPGEEHCSERESLVRRGREGLYWPRLSLQAQEGPEHGKATMCRTKRYKYVRRLLESDELYDLETDPGEVDNRIADPSFAGVLAELRERMLGWYQETCDVVPLVADERF